MSGMSVFCYTTIYFFSQRNGKATLDFKIRNLRALRCFSDSSLFHARYAAVRIQNTLTLKSELVEVSDFSYAAYNFFTI